jgi:hypothetical protein
LKPLKTPFCGWRPLTDLIIIIKEIIRAKKQLLWEIILFDTKGDKRRDISL